MNTEITALIDRTDVILKGGVGSGPWDAIKKIK